jgi:hypothetical protein
MINTLLYFFIFWSCFCIKFNLIKKNETISFTD